MFRLWIVTAATLIAAGTAKAQHASPSPYSGLEARPIKGPSDQQIADLRAGRGMGLALPAELNGYPGPIHVLELGDRLGPTGEQRTRVRDLHAAMRTETVPLGERLIAQETDLDRQFATQSVAPASLQAATPDIGATQGALRGPHLRYHSFALEVLTPEQVRRYSELRGYGTSGSHGHGPKSHH
ncbi:hypothetical protein [Microvirga makkahensis]|uniref:LTXXQ motif family protein n=1 Tax=Microvirga makkahensis TaxID=1128670 RepID=A0A7X3SPB5_9HYPH|nr:hypothetical protein [Microvirga makkahensis]MXQ12291.1 hypothetical protein [Microvirga makkahensis]